MGDDDFRAETVYFGMKGYEWVGWKRNSERNLMYKLLNGTHTKPINSLDSMITQSLPYVPLAFKFDYIRNFSSVSIHCNNLFTKDVQVFTKAVVQFSLNGVFNNNNNNRFGGMSKSQLVFEIPSDMHNESARFIKLELENYIARYIRIKLYFSSKWLLISEIDFYSTPVPNTHESSNMKPVVINNDIELKTFTLESTLSIDTIPTSTSTTTTTTTTTSTLIYQSTPIAKTTAVSTPLKQYYVIILIISILILFCILGLIITVILLNKQKYKNKSAKLHQ